MNGEKRTPTLPSNLPQSDVQLDALLVFAISGLVELLATSPNKVM
jgi:hypothetical protein